jgi:threonine dehydrogenase-like Zn-dependent dehydrogenase
VQLRVNPEQTTKDGKDKKGKNKSSCAFCVLCALSILGGSFVGSSKKETMKAVCWCGPRHMHVEVGLLTIKCAYLLGALRVIAIDRFPERLRLARQQCNAEVINY